MLFSWIPWKVFKSPIHSKTGHILETKNMNVNFITQMFIINKPSMLFDFVIMEVTWYFISCKHEWFSLKYHERFLNLLFTLKTGHILETKNMNVNLNTLMIIINKPSISFNFVIGRYTIFTFGNMKGFSLHTIMEGFFPISQY